MLAEGDCDFLGIVGKFDLFAKELGSGGNDFDCRKSLCYVSGALSAIGVLFGIFFFKDA